MQKLDLVCAYVLQESYSNPGQYWVFPLHQDLQTYSGVDVEGIRRINRIRRSLIRQWIDACQGEAGQFPPGSLNAARQWNNHWMNERLTQQELEYYLNQYEVYKITRGEQPNVSTDDP